MSSIRRSLPVLLGIAVLAVVLFAGWHFYRQGSFSGAFVFKDLSGPQQPSIIAPPVAARWQDFAGGGNSRMAILLTDPDSAWLGLVMGLQSIGLPFTITRDYQEALQHRVVMVYPTVSGRVLPAEALQALARYPASGGTLVGINVEGGGLNEVFGFGEAQPARTRRSIAFDVEQPLAREFQDPREKLIPFSNPASGANAAGSFGYTGVAAPLARFNDGSAAITARRIGEGHAYAFGIDPGFVLLTGYNNREQGVARSYANEYEPALDVLLRLLRGIYREGEPTAVTLATVPAGKALATLITHDVDYGVSLRNAAQYAEFEAGAGIRASYFIQTKYVRDWNDDVFFNDEAIATLRHLRDLKMEVASHSVAHSLQFNQLPLGDGRESYPQYRPFVRDQARTDHASVFGELRVSRFLLGHFLPEADITSFRPGHLRNPYALPQDLEASGYRFSSSVSANNSLTHLPFRLTVGRETSALSAIYEFPVTIEDEAKPRLGDRLPQALALADRLASYGGLLVVLIHPDVTNHKLAFERQLVEALRERAWFGTVQELGEFWSARDRVALDVERQGKQLQVKLVAGAKINGLTLQLPTGYRLLSAAPGDLTIATSGNALTIQTLSGAATLTLEPLP